MISDGGKRLVVGATNETLGDDGLEGGGKLQANLFLLGGGETAIIR